MGVAEGRSGQSASDLPQGVVLEAKGLSRQFFDGIRTINVLDGLDLTVQAGETVAVIGESGVGKSTMLHLLGALDSADGGEVRLEGENLFDMASHEIAAVRNRKIGFVFQFHHLLGDFNAAENVMMPLLVAGKSPSVARGRAHELLEKVGLSDRLTHRPGELSGGEQQRVAVARAVALSPRVVLADEPTGNLDPRTAEEMHGLLVSIQRSENCAMVVATHNPALAQLLDRTLRLRAGKLEAVSAR